MSQSTFASDDCSSAPKSKGMKEKDVQAKLEQQGYGVKRIRTDDGCYQMDV